MTTKRRFLNLFVTFSFAQCALLSNGRCDEIEPARKHWAQLESLLAMHSVTYKRIAADATTYTAGEFLRKNKYYLTTEEINDQAGVRLFNPDYRATIAKGEKESWRIRWLGSDNRISSVTMGGSQNDLFIMQICDPSSVATVLKNLDLATDLKLIEGGVGFSLKIAETLPDHCGIPKEYAGARVRVYGPLDQYPTKIEILFASASVGPKGDRLEYKSFVEIRETRIPTIVMASYIDAFDGESKNPSEYQYDYARFDEPLDTKRCYLSYYGLPEPGGRSDRWRLLLLLIAVIGGLCVAGWWRMRHSQFRG